MREMEKNFKKAPRDIERLKAMTLPYNLVIIEEPGYKKNIDIRRIYSNYILSRNTLQYLEENADSYDLVYCVIPPNVLSAKVGKFCRRHKIPFIVDIEDLWPEAMKMVFKVPILSDIIFYPYWKNAEKTYRLADGVVGTSDEYTMRAFKKRKPDIPFATVYVGTEVDVFDEGVWKYRHEFEKAEGGFRVTYAGSIGTSYDIKTLIDAAKIILQQVGEDIKFYILGTGPLKEELEQYAKDMKCDNVIFMGYVEYQKMAAFLSESDILINSYIRDEGENMGELISVIIPCFNAEKYIDRCMESVLNQTYRDLEIILVDDGSTDSTGEICDRYSQMDTRVVVVHKKNGGLSSARNAGLSVATGLYIGFVDSDDWIEYDFYSYLYDLIVQYQTDIAQCTYFLTDGSSFSPVIIEEIKRVNRDDLMDIFFRSKKEKSNSGVWNRLYKHEIVREIEFPDGYVNEDVYYSYFVFLKACSAVISNQPKYNYYINENGITRGALRKQDLSLYYVWDQIIEDAKKQHQQYYEKAVLNRKRAIFTLLCKYVIYGIEDYDTFSSQWILEQVKELRTAYGKLMSSKSLNIKRKLALSFLCLSPEMVRFIYLNLKRYGIGVK